MSLDGGSLDKKSTNTDPDAVHSYASGTKLKVTEIDVTTLTGEVNITHG